MKLTSLFIATVAGQGVAPFNLQPDPPLMPMGNMFNNMMTSDTDPTAGGMGMMDPMMLFFLLGDDSALKTRAEYITYCASAPAANQAACTAAIDTLYDASGSLILDCTTIADATAAEQCKAAEKLNIGTIMGFGGSSGGLLGGLGGGNNSDLLLLMMMGGMNGGMGGGMGGLLPLLLLSDGGLNLGSSSSSSSGLDIKTLLLLQMMGGGQMGGQMGTMDPMMMYLLLKN